VAKITCLSGCCDWTERDVVERERTPRRLMELRIRLHLAVLSPLNTIHKLEKLVSTSRKKALPTGCRRPIYSPPAVGVWITSHSRDGDPNHRSAVLAVRGYRSWFERIQPFEALLTMLTVLMHRFLRELRKKHDGTDAVFLVDRAQHLATALQRAGLRLSPVRHGTRNAIERVF